MPFVQGQCADFDTLTGADGRDAKPHATTEATHTALDAATR
ncbi:hypothetical protein BSLA_02r2360 [Burkholderia stabilis]|nr:hypothetical protein BSLA_02r2360 [Burkholderia stabilis]